MTTEYVLILGLYAFILLGTFLGDHGPIATFKKSGPRLAAKIEGEIQVGMGAGSNDSGAKLNLGAHGFNRRDLQKSIVNWSDPSTVK